MKRDCRRDCTCDEGHKESSTKRLSIDSISELLKITSPSPTVSQQKSSTDQIVFVEEIVDMKRIKSDTVQLAVWRQTQVPKFVTTLSNPSIAAADLPTFEGIVKSDEVLETIKPHLWCPYKLRSYQNRALTENEIDELVNHIDQLVRIFAEICKESGLLDDESEFINVKLIVTNDDGCKFWHQDSVPFRMIATYRGPCTEWIPPAFSKATLSRHRLNSNHYQSLTHNDVALFKSLGRRYLWSTRNCTSFAPKQCRPFSPGS